MVSCRICVADDCVETATVLCEGLKLHGYDAIPAYSGGEALNLCAKEPFDMILLDVCIPEIDGYEVCRRLKADPKTRDIGVLFVTVKGTVDDIARGFDLGAIDYITKPYNLPIVMVRVDAAFRAKSVQDELRGRYDMLRDTVYTDELTGLRNRRFMLERLQEEVEKAHRYDYPISCVVLDVDEIRAEDEELGPVSMDDLLAEVAMTLRNHSRTYDVLARYDGTLFVAVLPHAPLADAVGYAEKILGEIDATTFCDPSFPTEVRLSCGIITCRNGSAHAADFVLGEAMRGLLQAKSLTGRRIVARSLNEE